MRVFLGWNDMFDRGRGAEIRFLFHLTLSDRFSGANETVPKMGPQETLCHVIPYFLSWISFESIPRKRRMPRFSRR